MSQIEIKVACAVPARQRCLTLKVPVGTTAREALSRSELQREFPEIDMARCALGVWGRVVGDDYPLSDGDRLEVCRPLKMDPREARRRQASSGGTMSAVSRVLSARRER